MPYQSSIDTSKIGSRKETLKSTLQNCAERPIGEYMRSPLR